ncbi:MAG: response regulator [Rickettsiales bacterium]|nr:response regulator [Rickettsiales bacterium]
MELFETTRSTSRSKLKLLIVEDDMTHFIHLSSLLRERGHHVKVVNSGEEALATLQQNRYHAVFLDIMLPKMDGFSVIEKLQSLPALKNIPVIVTSAHVMQNFAHRFPKNSVTAFLSKPIGQSLLDITLQELENHAVISS